MTKMKDWSVRAHVDREDGFAMWRPLVESPPRREVRGIRQTFIDLDSREGPIAITMEVQATSADEARILVQHLLGEVRRAAGLPVQTSRIVWVAPLEPDEESSHRFLEHAEELYQSESYELAVVAAQIHFEVQGATLLRMLSADSSKLADALLASRIEWNLMQGWQRDILENLLAVKLSKDFSAWKRYQAHVERRNAVVHQGQAVDRESAKESIAVVREFWIWLSDAAIRSTRQSP